MTVGAGLKTPFAVAGLPALLLGWAVTVWPSPLSPPDAPVRAEDWVRFGVIVASREGLPGDKTLQYAYADGMRLEKLLRGLGQMDSAHVRLLRVESASALRAQLDGIGDAIAAQRAGGRKVMLQFYYTGHGGARQFHVGGEQVGFGEVKALLEKGRPEARIYVLDVCQGASFFASKGFSATQPVRVAIDLDKATRGEVTISSSASEEQAYEVRTLGGSIFTSHWEMALRGAGDRNHDGQVTLFEAYNYAYDQTVAFSRETLNLPQHPSFSIDLTGAKDLLLTRPGAEQGGFIFHRCPVGVYSLLDIKRGAPVGEMRIPEIGDYSLALEPGAYRIDHTPAQGPVVSALAEVSGMSLTPVHIGLFGKRPKGFALGKGSEKVTWAEEPRGGVFWGGGADASPWIWNSWAGLLTRDRVFAWEDFLPGAEIDAKWSLAGSDNSGGFGTGFGLQTLKSGGSHFLGGFHFGFDRFLGRYRAEGHEEMPGLPAGQSPDLTLQTRVNSTALQFGPMVATPLWGRRRFLVSADILAGVVYRNLHVTSETVSQAYGPSRSERDYSGWGYALEGYLTPGFHWVLPGLQENLRLGLRLGGGFHGAEEAEGKDGVIPLHSVWIGRMGLQISLAGGRP